MIAMSSEMNPQPRSRTMLMTVLVLPVSVWAERRLARPSTARPADLRGQPQGLSQRKSLRLFTGNNRRPVHILHNQIVRPDIVNLADVGMIQRRAGFSFPLEPFAELRGGNFDRDEAIQTRVSGPIHFPHATLANFGFHAIGTQLRSWGK